MQTLQDELVDVTEREKQASKNLTQMRETHKQSLSQREDGTAQILMKFQDELAHKDKQLAEF